MGWASGFQSYSFEYLYMCLCACACTFVRSTLGPFVFGVVQLYRDATAAWESFMCHTNWQIQSNLYARDCKYTCNQSEYSECSLFPSGLHLQLYEETNFR